MSVLSAGQIRERIYKIDPRDPERIFIVPAPNRDDIKDASVDLFLGNYFTVTKTAKFSALEAREALSDGDIAS
jgi:hypothetical protein